MVLVFVRKYVPYNFKLFEFCIFFLKIYYSLNVFFLADLYINK